MKILTFKQYRERWLNSCRYKKKYLQNKKLLEHKFNELKTDWIKYLQELSQNHVFPHWVCTDFIRQFGEKELFRTFRGVYQKGISKFRIPS